MSTPRPAGIYVRISQDSFGDGLGVKRQRDDCEALAIQKGWSIAEVYEDNDTSASNGKPRPAYQRMMSDVEQGHIRAVVVWDVDRLTRTPRELEDVIDYADRKGLLLASVGGDIDLGTEQGRMMARMKGTLARYEVEQSSRRLRRKFLERAEAGLPHGKVAYGYRREQVTLDNDKVATRDVIDPEQAAVIREAARRFLDRESGRQIVKDFNERGLLSPRGIEWEAATLRQVLLRPRNAGRQVHQGKVIGEAAWEPILDGDTFDRLVALLRDPARRTNRGAKLTHLLSGIARCGREGCGGTMRVAVRRQNNGKHQPEGYNCKKCFRVRRKMSDVDALVEAVLLGRLAMADGPNLLGGDPEVMREASEQIEAIQGRMDVAADDYAEGLVTSEQLRRINAKLMPQLDAARARWRAAQPSPELAEFAGEQAEEKWAKAPLEVKRAIIDMLMEIHIMPSGRGRSFDPEQVKIAWKGAAA